MAEDERGNGVIGMVNRGVSMGFTPCFAFNNLFNLD